LALSEPAAAEAPATAVLSLSGVDAGYGKKQVLQGVSLGVGGGEAIALLGHNGAGKTTILQVIFGLLPAWKGTVTFDGQAVRATDAARSGVALGMAMIPSERFVFPDLTVLENLRLSARGLSAAEWERQLAAAYEDFPILRARGSQLAGVMSGGEQRMVSLAMALIRRPSLLLLDEPSLGLSPAIAEQLMAQVRRLVEGGMSVVLVEQNIPAALRVVNRVYVLRSGKIILEEEAATLAAMPREKWWSLF
jgi:branched-chain amino acid transport system ATP-binding protein